MKLRIADVLLAALFMVLGMLFLLAFVSGVNEDRQKRKLPRVRVDQMVDGTTCFFDRDTYKYINCTK